MPYIFAENNVCGQIILNLVSRGNAIISELLRMKDYIPDLFTTDSKVEIQKYQDLIMDFTYFDIAEAQEHKIDQNKNLLELDEQFRDNHIEIITRFYTLFESFHAYATDLNQFLSDLENGIYIHQSLETIFADIEGKQIMCESLYLYGLMLLLVDAHITGIVREKMLVSYYRYTPQTSNARSSIDEVCKLLRDTGFHTRKVQNYPEDYFKRIKMNPTFVDMVIGRLRTDDIYSQLPLYPLPKHRSTALANQAAMLYVCLYFSPNTLHSESAIMREIVDKYFPDNWIISIYMGFIVNLVETWDNFKAAKVALTNSLEPNYLRGIARTHGTNLQSSIKLSDRMLTEGNITKELILRDMNNILALLRECNVTLRWMMLHTNWKPKKQDRNKRCKQINELVTGEAKCGQNIIFKLLLNTAQLELNVKELFKIILNEKKNQWEELKSKSIKGIKELAEILGENKPSSRLKRNEHLEKWFLEISKQIDSLDIEETSTSRKIVQLVQALEEVQEFHQLGTNMQIVQILNETRSNLSQMVQTLSVKEDNFIAMQIIGDISFAWQIIDTYRPIMQMGIKREPNLVIKLRAIFLKLASAMEIPLLRINQAQASDLISVSEYYSKELEIYVRKVLQIIPTMMFEKMSRIMEMQTTVLKELPTRLDKDKLKDYAQLDERFEFAELTHSVSLFGQGMRMMKTTLVGVVCLDPKKLLEDGIRNELVEHISRILHTELTFNNKMKTSELEQKLNSLGRIMDGYKRSFEYIQDYVNINGLKIWQEEITRIINYNVEQECNGFLRLKVHAWDSQYQNRIIPIPIHSPIDSMSVNFIGRLAREIINLANPRNTTYVGQTITWYETKSQKSVLNRKTLTSLSKAIEIAGVMGLDRLFSFMIITALQKIMGLLQNIIGKQSLWYSIISSTEKGLKSTGDNASTVKNYSNCINRTIKIWPELLEETLLIGELQLLRKMIAFHLNLSAKFNAKNLEAALQSLSKAILENIKKNHQWKPEEELLYSLTRYLEYSGINNPHNTIYVTPSSHMDYSQTIFLFVISHLKKLFISKTMDNLHKRIADQVDGYVFCLGVHTLIKQFHPELNESFIKNLTKYIIDLMMYHKSLKNNESCFEAVNAINFLEIYSQFSEVSSNLYKSYLPEEIKYL